MCVKEIKTKDLLEGGKTRIMIAERIFTKNSLSSSGTG
jgi:hypothetical protein